jgi:hypothetical protein
MKPLTAPRESDDNGYFLGNSPISIPDGERKLMNNCWRIQWNIGYAINPVRFYLKGSPMCLKALLFRQFRLHILHNYGGLPNSPTVIRCLHFPKSTQSTRCIQRGTLEKSTSSAITGITRLPLRRA